MLWEFWLVPEANTEHIHVKDELEAAKQLPLTFAKENILLNKNIERLKARSVILKMKRKWGVIKISRLYLIPIGSKSVSNKANVKGVIS